MAQSNNYLHDLVCLYIHYAERLWPITKYLGADVGMTAFLHTHTRRVDITHLHIVALGDGVNKTQAQWSE